MLDDEARLVDEIVGYRYVVAGKVVAFCADCASKHSAKWTDGMQSLFNTDKIHWLINCAKCGKKIYDD